MTTFNDLADDTLITMYAEGNNEAFDALLERHKDRLYNYILFLVHNETVADDLFQETFVKIICRIQSGKYRPEGKFVSWMVRIAHNLVLDYHRDCAATQEISSEETDYDLLNDRSLYDDCCENQLVYQQTLTDIGRIAELLPDNQSEVIRMRYYYNMSFREIADTLGISINTALGRVRYALINMRKIAQDHNISLVV